MKVRRSLWWSTSEGIRTKRTSLGNEHDSVLITGDGENRQADCQLADMRDYENVAQKLQNGSFVACLTLLVIAVLAL